MWSFEDLRTSTNLHSGQKKTKTNNTSILSFNSHIRRHSVYHSTENREQQHCQGFRSVANSDFLFPSFTSAQSSLRASSLLLSHPDISCLHVLSNSSRLIAFQFLKNATNILSLSTHTLISQFRSQHTS